MTIKDRVKLINRKLKQIERETADPWSSYYCTVNARKIKEAVGLLDEFLRDDDERGNDEKITRRPRTWPKCTGHTSGRVD